MGIIRTRLVDFLGHMLSDSGVSKAETTIVKGLEECRWMEVAREVMASYVTAALQLSEIRFYSSSDMREYANSAWLWNVSPNPNQSRAEFISALCHKLLVEDGEALVVPRSVGGRTTIHLADGYSREEHPLGQDKFSGISFGGVDGTLNETLLSSDVFYFTVGGGRGGWSALMQQLDSHYDRLADTIITAARDHAVPKWIYRADRPTNGTMAQLEQDKETIKSNLKAFTTARSTSVLPLFKGQEIERVAEGAHADPIMPDAVSAIRKDMFESVAVCMRIPTSLLYGNTNNFTELVSALLTFAVDPVARSIDDELTRKTYTPSSWAAGAHARVDTAHVRHVDLFAVADQVEKLVGSSIDSPNEIRGFTGQDRIGASWADEYQRTKNHESAGGGETND